MNWFLAAFAGTLGGCHSGVVMHTVAAPPAVLPGGWTAAEARDHSATLGIPPGWRVGVDAGNTGLADMLKGIGTQSPQMPGESDPGGNPQMQDIAQRAAESDKKDQETAWANLESKRIYLQVLNGSRPIPGEKRTRFYLKHTKGDGPVYTGQAIDVERKAWAFPPHPTEAKLPIGTALRFQSDDSLRDGATLHQISYVILDGADTYTLRFVTEEDGQVISSIADGVAQSLRIKAAKP